MARTKAITTTKPETKRRLQVICTPKQEEIIDQAAEAAGMGHDRSAWILAHSLRAASGPAGEGTPLLITGNLAERIRATAAQQGVTPEKIVEQWAIVGATGA